MSSTDATSYRPGGVASLAIAALAGVLVALAVDRSEGRSDAPRGGGPRGAGDGAGTGAGAMRFEGGRGRGAETPSQVPARGWWDILKRTAREFSRDRLLMVAAGVAFYVLLAIFPALVALVSIYGFFADPATVTAQIEQLAGVLPEGATEIIGEQLTRLASQGSAAGLGALIGIAVALWSANAGTKAMFDAMNVVYDEQETRGFVKLTLITLACTLGLILFAILALLGIVAVPVALGWLGLGGYAQWLAALRWPLLLVLAAGLIAVLYRYAPSRVRPKWRWVTWGGALAALLWLVGSLAFSWYVSNFGNYNETYGSLGAVIAFMTWLWLSVTVVLLGAELNAELEHQTAHDTTVGEPGQPMGARGARMADTLGEAPA